MEINKANLLKAATEITAKPFQEKGNQSGAKSSKAGKIKTEPSVLFSKLRGKVQSLQAELGKIQTKMTDRQSALKYAEEIMELPNRKELLMSFVENKLPKAKYPKSDFHGLRLALAKDIAELTETLKTKEVELENILASGYATPENHPAKEIPIIKDAAEAKKVFAAINEINVKKVLDNVN
ncbi:MAG: hypothetical protein D6767_02245 [Candidatus Hydrogenedentota bacterium]|nr:MAG: hypothetical protein D6767_02245 [Candidatus Hydrogenedentota bacterium]